MTTQQHAWTLNPYAKVKKADLEDCTLYDSIYTPFSKRPDYRDGRQTHGFQ